MKRIILLGIASLLFASLSAQNLVINGDLEGSELVSFIVKDFANNNWGARRPPRIMSDESSNHFIVVTSNNNPSHDYDSQLFITFPEPLPMGSDVSVNMKIKADRNQESRMELQSTPGGYIDNISKKINFSTEWTTYNHTFLVGHDNIRTLALSLSEGRENNLYFDDIKVEVLPVEGYAKSLDAANDFLVAHGVQSPVLSLKYKAETFCAYSDSRSKCFVVVVSDFYIPYMDNPILAYSIGESSWGSTSADADNSIFTILAYYDYQIKHLYQHNEVYKFLLESIYKPKSSKVGPYLGDIRYNQGYPYNKQYPYDQSDDIGTKKQCVAGCGPVAMAQILSYYHHPVTLKGKRAVTTKSGKRYRKDLADYQVCWDGSDDDLANLVFSCAISISADMSPKETSSSIVNIREAFSKYWGFSRGCRLMEDFTDYSKLASIYYELESGRPMIVTDNKHLWVCDGYENDFLHYNLGWGGSYNGYYRAMIVPSIGGKQMTFKDILIGIEPRRK